MPRKYRSKNNKSRRREFNPLVVMLSPRKIKAVMEAIDTLPYDRLWIKHYPATQAYPLMDAEFEKRKEYTHLIPVPDDLVVPWEKLQILVKDITEGEIPDDIRDNCVVGGYCNIDTHSRQQISNVSFSLPSAAREVGEGRSYLDYKFLNIMGIQNLAPEYWSSFSQFLFETKFNGLTSWIIPRRVKEQFRFRNDSATGYSEDGCCWDVMACHDLNALGIPLYTDRRVFMQHLRGSQESAVTFLLDPAYREVKFERRGGLTSEEEKALDEKAAEERLRFLRKNSARVF